MAWPSARSVSSRTSPWANPALRSSRCDQAIAAYDRALQQRPGMPDAVANRAAVDAARKRKPPPGGQSQQGPQQGGDQQRDQGQQRDAQQSRQPGRPQGDPSRQPGQGSQDKTADPRQQQQADAAQRQRMQDALRKQGQSQVPGQPRPQPAETPEQRDRRIAIAPTRGLQPFDRFALGGVVEPGADAVEVITPHAGFAGKCPRDGGKFALPQGLCQRR